MTNPPCNPHIRDTMFSSLRHLSPVVLAAALTLSAAAAAEGQERYNASQIATASLPGYELPTGLVVGLTLAGRYYVYGDLYFQMAIEDLHVVGYRPEGGTVIYYDELERRFGSDLPPRDITDGAFDVAFKILSADSRECLGSRHDRWGLEYTLSVEQGLNAQIVEGAGAFAGQYSGDLRYSNSGNVVSDEDRQTGMDCIRNARTDNAWGEREHIIIQDLEITDHGFLIPGNLITYESRIADLLGVEERGSAGEDAVWDELRRLDRIAIDLDDAASFNAAFESIQSLDITTDEQRAYGQQVFNRLSQYRREWRERESRDRRREAEREERERINALSPEVRNRIMHDRLVLEAEALEQSGDYAGAARAYMEAREYVPSSELDARIERMHVEAASSIAREGAGTLATQAVDRSYDLLDMAGYVLAGYTTANGVDSYDRTGYGAGIGGIGNWAVHPSLAISSEFDVSHRMTGGPPCGGAYIDCQEGAIDGVTWTNLQALVGLNFKGYIGGGYGVYGIGATAARNDRDDLGGSMILQEGTYAWIGTKQTRGEIVFRASMYSTGDLLFGNREIGGPYISHVSYRGEVGINMFYIRATKYSNVYLSDNDRPMDDITSDGFYIMLGARFLTN